VFLSIVKYPRRRWVKYAGSWDFHAKVSLTSKFQKWWLNHGLHRGLVTVNGTWPGQPRHVHSFFNPCIDDDLLDQLKTESSEKQLTYPLNILFAGRLSKEKGASRVIEIATKLHNLKIPIHVDIFGEGPELPWMKEKIIEFGLRDQVKLHGWVAHNELLPFYKTAHFILLPSDSEGWPKVLSEGMACGAVPVASRVGSIPELLNQFGIGRICEVDHVEGYANAILDYFQNPEKWTIESKNAFKNAHLFTYGYYIKRVSELLGL